MQRQRMNAHKFTNPGLQNRRLQVRFLSHLPSQVLNLSRLLQHGAQPILRALTPFDPNGAIACGTSWIPRPLKDGNNLAEILTHAVGALLGDLATSILTKL